MLDSGEKKRFFVHGTKRASLFLVVVAAGLDVGSFIVGAEGAFRFFKSLKGLKDFSGAGGSGGSFATGMHVAGISLNNVEAERDGGHSVVETGEPRAFSVVVDAGWYLTLVWELVIGLGIPIYIKYD